VDSSTTLVSTFSTTGTGLIAREAGRVAALPPLREDRDMEAGTVGAVGGEF